MGNEPPLLKTGRLLVNLMGQGHVVEVRSGYREGTEMDMDEIRGPLTSDPYQVASNPPTPTILAPTTKSLPVPLMCHALPHTLFSLPTASPPFVLLANQSFISIPAKASPRDPCSAPLLCQTPSLLHLHTPPYTVIIFHQEVLLTDGVPFSEWSLQRYGRDLNDAHLQGEQRALLSFCTDGWIHRQDVEGWSSQRKLGGHEQQSQSLNGKPDGHRKGGRQGVGGMLQAEAQRRKAARLWPPSILSGLQISISYIRS